MVHFAGICHFDVIILYNCEVLLPCLVMLVDHISWLDYTLQSIFFFWTESMRSASSTHEAPVVSSKFLLLTDTILVTQLLEPSYTSGVFLTAARVKISGIFGPNLFIIPSILVINFISFVVLLFQLKLFFIGVK